MNESQQVPSPPPPSPLTLPLNTKPKHQWRASSWFLIVTTSLISAILVGVVVYLFQQSRINVLESKLNSLVATEAKEGELSLRLVAPQGVKSFCLGEPVVIEWEGSPEIEFVRISLGQPTASAPLGEFPVSFKDGEVGNDGRGRYTWQAGKLSTTFAREGYVYDLSIDGRYTISKADGSTESKQVVDRTKERFALLRCETPLPQASSTPSVE